MFQLYFVSEVQKAQFTIFFTCLTTLYYLHVFKIKRFITPQQTYPRSKGNVLSVKKQKDGLAGISSQWRGLTCKNQFTEIFLTHPKSSALLFLRICYHECIQHSQADALKGCFSISGSAWTQPHARTRAMSSSCCPEMPNHKKFLISCQCSPCPEDLLCEKTRNSG